MLGVLAFVVIVLIATLIRWSSVIISKIISIIILHHRNDQYDDQENGLSEARIRGRSLIYNNRSKGALALITT